MASIPWAEQGAKVASAILEAGRSATNEAELRRMINQALHAFAVETGITFTQSDERTMASGRLDSVYNKFIVEFKRPGFLSEYMTAAGNVAALKQIEAYMDEVATDSASPRLAGAIIDGSRVIFCRRLGGQFVADPVRKIDDATIGHFLRLMASTSGRRALLPDNLIQDFAMNSSAMATTVRALWKSLNSETSPLSSVLYQQWATYYSEVAGYDLAIDPQELEALLKKLELQAPIDFSRLLFCIHTYFSILMKFMSIFVLQHLTKPAGIDPASLLRTGGAELQKKLREIEDGRTLRRVVGVANLYEGDFFQWYAHAWSPQLDSSLRQVLAKLEEYDPETLDLTPEESRDLLKALYQYLLPRQIRHALGEYYTPDWLAEFTLNSLTGTGPNDPYSGDPDKRILDPACGSGTFLVLAIESIKARCRRDSVNPTAALEKILTAVVGFDLNPVAVIAARTNYLIAIREFIPARRHDITIPVYLCDSILIPALIQDIAGARYYKIDTAVGSFRLPASSVQSGTAEHILALVEECVAAGTSKAAFEKRLEKIQSLSSPETAAVLELYSDMLVLHNFKKDGVWAPVLRNFIAPIHAGKFHFVVGNPPWVNWQSLPEKYRADILPLFQDRYGLTAGFSRGVGSARRELASLFTYVALDRYLIPGGTLSFVITQTLLQTQANSGFRKFKIEKGAEIRLRFVADMTSFQPFEDATNRTAVVSFEKGAPTQFPVPYTKWKVNAGERPPNGNMSLKDILATTTRLEWHATPMDPRDRTSGFLIVPPSVTPFLGPVLGGSPYEANEGTNTGGANAVFWCTEVGPQPGGKILVENLVQGAKRKVEQIKAPIEAKFLYSLVRGRDLSQWACKPSASIILAYDSMRKRFLSVEELQVDGPSTWAYLTKFKDALLARKDTITKGLMKKYGIQAMGGIGPHCFRPYKVAWREIATEFHAAVVEPTAGGRPTMLDHKLMYVSLESRAEAHYLCAILNSSIASVVVKGMTIQTQISTLPIEHLMIGRFDPRNEVHQSLSKWSMDAHEGRVGDQLELDRLTGKFFGLNPREADLFNRVASSY